uniref:Uncharacterized protein n=1 Tax=Globisporangium ultimum (strain ATCC 200006 / CBS 805.95 / DAOM BR144) TaxID=431595 RepID=K3WYG5_GLOUD
MYSTLAGNWDFLASLSVVEEEKPTSPDVEAPATDVPAEECAEEDAALPEPEYEDECFGDLEYDDNYYSYHSTSTPCV